MRVFLTGGTGLLGAHVAALLRARGTQVVALHRSSSDTRALRASGCGLVEGDLADDVSSLRAGMEGCTHLVHSAALVYAGSDWGAVRSVNVDGTRHVLEAAAGAGVGRAVHVSSVVVYGAAAGHAPEATAPDGPLPEGDLYARSKRLAETAAREVAQDRGIALEILRPAALYGEGDRLTAPRLARLARAPVTFLVGSGANTVPLVYAGNAAEAVLEALDGEGEGRVYDVGLDHPVTQRGALAALARGLGVDPAFVPLPVTPLRWVGDLLGRMGVSAPGAAGLSPGRVVRLASGDNPFPSHRIRTTLGWAPSHDPLDALERTGRWLSGCRAATLSIPTSQKEDE